VIIPGGATHQVCRDQRRATSRLFVYLRQRHGYSRGRRRHHLLFRGARKHGATPAVSNHRLTVQHGEPRLPASFRGYRLPNQRPPAVPQPDASTGPPASREVFARRRPPEGRFSMYAVVLRVTVNDVDPDSRSARQRSRAPSFSCAWIQGTATDTIDRRWRPNGLSMVCLCIRRQRAPQPPTGYARWSPIPSRSRVEFREVRRIV